MAEEDQERTPQDGELETIASQEARIGELEGALAHFQEAVATKEEEVAALKQQLSAAATKYRAAVLAGAPEVPEELVTGGTVEQVDNSLVMARSMVEKIRQQLESQTKAERVPAGAPVRTPPDLSGLSPREKIAHALARFRG